MKKIKILYILTRADIGGAQKYVADLAENLDKEKFEAKILYGGKDLRWLSNKVHPWFLFANDWLTVYEIFKILKKENPDVIHLNSSKAGVVGALAAQVYKVKSRKLKVIFTAHGWVFNPTNQLNPVTRYSYIALHKISAYFQDEIICVSEYDYHLARQYGIKPRGSLHTIHNGIDSNLKFLKKENAREEILSKLKLQISNFKKNNAWIGSIGRLVKEKNYETFIRAAALVPNAYFFLIGEGQEQKNLELRIMNEGLKERFFIIPPSGDDAKYLKAFDLFAMSSIKEGLPYTLLEAMTAGLPIVVTEAGGIPEMIKNHQSGMMVSQKNPEQLAKAISGLLANPSIAGEISLSAKKTAMENFNIKKMIDKTEAVYLESGNKN